MVKLFFYLAILIGVGYAAQRVPIGDRTAVQHLQEHVRWESVRDAGADAVASFRGLLSDEAPPAVAVEVKSSPAPAKANEAKPAAKAPADEADRAPAERLTAADRRALEALLPR